MSGPILTAAFGIVLVLFSLAVFAVVLFVLVSCLVYLVRNRHNPTAFADVEFPPMPRDW